MCTPSTRKTLFCSLDFWKRLILAAIRATFKTRQTCDSSHTLLRIHSQNELNGRTWAKDRLLTYSASVCNEEARCRKLLRFYLEAVIYLLRKFATKRLRRMSLQFCVTNDHPTWLLNNTPSIYLRNPERSRTYISRELSKISLPKIFIPLSGTD